MTFSYNLYRSSSYNRKPTFYYRNGYLQVVFYIFRHSRYKDIVDRKSRMQVARKSRNSRNLYCCYYIAKVVV